MPITTLSGAGGGGGASVTRAELASGNTLVINILGGVSSVISPGATITINEAGSTMSGYLSTSDWNTFNNKLGASLFPIVGTVNQVSVTGGVSCVYGQTVTLSLPQNIGISNAPTFTDLNIAGWSSYLLGVTTSLIGKYAALDAVHQNSLEPMGFINRTDSTLGYSLTSLSLDLSGTFDYYVQGKRYSHSGITTLAHGATIGTWYYYLVPGGLTVAQTFPNLAIGAPAAFVYYNNTAGTSYWLGANAIMFDERHGIAMDYATHSNLHNSIGAIQVGSGFALSGAYTLASGTGGNTLNCYGLGQGTILDEDISFNIDQLTADATSAIYPVFYRVGASNEWRWYTNTFPYLYNVATSNIFYNENNAGTWQLTAATTNGTYINYYVCAVNAHSSYTANRFVWIMGQGTFSSLALAQADSILNLDLTGLPFMELVPLWQVTMRREATYADVGGNARIEGIKRISGTRIASVTTSVSPTNHNNLSNRGDANSHPISAIGGAVSHGIPYGLTALTGLQSSSSLTFDDVTLRAPMVDIEQSSGGTFSAYSQAYARSVTLAAAGTDRYALVGYNEPVATAGITGSDYVGAVGVAVWSQDHPLGSNGGNFGLIGFQSSSQVTGSGASVPVEYAIGNFTDVDNSSSVATRSIINGYANFARVLNSGSGTIQKAALFVGATLPASGASGEGRYGMILPTMPTPNAGATSVAVFLMGQGGEKDGIQFGGDTNLYRNSANTLRTNDDFAANSLQFIGPSFTTSLRGHTLATSAQTFYLPVGAGSDGNYLGITGSQLYFIPPPSGGVWTGFTGNLGETASLGYTTTAMQLWQIQGLSSSMYMSPTPFGVSSTITDLQEFRFVGLNSTFTVNFVDSTGTSFGMILNGNMELARGDILGFQWINTLSSFVENFRSKKL